MLYEATAVRMLCGVSGVPVPCRITRSTCHGGGGGPVNSHTVLGSQECRCPIGGYESTCCAGSKESTRTHVRRWGWDHGSAYVLWGDMRPHAVRVQRSPHVGRRLRLGSRECQCPLG